MYNVSNKPSLIVNAMSNWITLVINVLIGFLLTPYIIRHIDKAGYGVWTLVGSVIGYFGVMRMGIGASLMRYIPYYIGKNEIDSAIGTFSTGAAYFFGVALIILGVSYFGAEEIAAFFNAGDEFVTLIKIFGVATSIGCISILLDAVLRSRERFVHANCIQISAAVLRGGGIFGVLHAGYGLIGMGMVVVFRQIFVLFCSFLVLARTCPEIKFSIRCIRFRYFGELFWFGTASLLTTLGFLLKFDADKIIVGHFMDMESVGIYSVATILMLYYRNFIGAGSRVLRPRFAYLDGRDSSTDNIRLFLLGTKANAWLASLGVAIVVLVGPSFIRLWVGHGFEQAYVLLLILACGHLFDQSQTVSVALLGGHGKQGVLAYFMIAEGFAAVVLAIILLQFLGLRGVALGFVLAPLISQVLIRPTYVCRHIGIRLAEYYRSGVVQSWFMAAVPLLYMVFFPKKRDLFISWWSLIRATLVLVLIYISLSYFIFLNSNERKTVTKKIQEYISKSYRIFSRRSFSEAAHKDNG